MENNQFFKILLKKDNIDYNMNQINGEQFGPNFSQVFQEING